MLERRAIGKERAKALCRVVGACALLLLFLGGCTAVVIPPDKPSEPVSVFLLDHGRHASLVVPHAHGGSVRYSYGDWDYYALRRTSIAHGLRALLWPSPAALGRQRLESASDLDGIHAQLSVEVVEALEIEVAGDAARSLHVELETLFEEARATQHYNAAYDLHLVRHPVPYTLAHNSNLVVAHWLERMGCTVEGRPVLSRWSLAPGAED